MNRRKSRCREKHARQNPHRQHHQVHQPAHRFHRLRARRHQQPERAEHQRRQTGKPAQAPTAARETARQTPATQIQETSPLQSPASRYATADTPPDTATLAWAKPPSASAASSGAHPQSRTPGPTSPSPSGSSPAVPAPQSRCTAIPFRAPVRSPPSPHPAAPPQSGSRRSAIIRAVRASGFVSSYRYTTPLADPARPAAQSFPYSQRVHARGLVHLRRLQSFVRSQRLRQLRRRRAHRQHVRQAGCETQSPAPPPAESEKQKSRRSPPARAASASAASPSIDTGCCIRAYSSRKFLPVSRTNTSSSVAECVLNSLKCSPCSSSAAKIRGTVVCSSLTESWCNTVVHAMRLHSRNSLQRVNVKATQTSAVILHSPAWAGESDRIVFRAGCRVLSSSAANHSPQTPQCPRRPPSQSAPSASPSQSLCRDP